MTDPRRWVLLYIYRWVDIGSVRSDDLDAANVVGDEPIVAYGCGCNGFYDISSRDILSGLRGNPLTYVSDAEGDRFEIIDPAAWPDHVCAELARRTLLGDGDGDDDDDEA